MSITTEYSESLNKSNSETHISIFSDLLFNVGMKTNDEVRRLNLELAIGKVGTAAQLAALASTAPAYLSQIKNKALDSKTGRPKGMGDDLARKIEAALGVGPGWMDTPHPEHWGEATVPNLLTPTARLANEVEDAPAISSRALKRIPLVGRVQAGADGLLHIDDYPPEHPEGFMLWWANCPEAYALRIRGESMSPRYLPGEFVGVDPCAEVMPSDEVILLLKDGRRMIKRLLWLRDGQACFESVNKDHPNIILDLEDIDQLHLVLGNIPKAAFNSN